VQIKNRLDELLFKSVRTRLARLLLKLSDQLGEESAEGRVIKIRLTHQDISDYVYAIKMNADNKVASMTKVWNAPWAMKELGWM